jgi:hypothetical protein
MKRLAVLGELTAACLAGSSPGFAGAPIAAPVTAVVQPHAIPVPADVIAAHPNGQPGAFTAVPDLQTAARLGTTPNAEERISCWRSYFTEDYSGDLGTEKESINPYWCGNGSIMRGGDSSWHGQTCSFLVSCRGEGGVGTWYGCPNGCVSLGQQITGHFSVYAILTNVNTDLTVVYELYPNGNYWSYGYHN